MTILLNTFPFFLGFIIGALSVISIRFDKETHDDKEKKCAEIDGKGFVIRLKDFSIMGNVDVTKPNRGSETREKNPIHENVSSYPRKDVDER